MNRNNFVTAEAGPSGLISLLSSHAVEQTVERLKDLLSAKGIKLFALVDHSGEAEAAGLNMRPTKLLIFGNPLSGTPVMLAAPSSAIDLPLKILVSEDADGQVWLSYNDPAYHADRHSIPHELTKNIAGVAMLADAAARR